MSRVIEELQWRKIIIKAIDSESKMVRIIKVRRRKILNSKCIKNAKELEEPN